MAGALASVTPAARTIFFMEGGYDLDAIRESVSATLSGAAGIAMPDEEHRSRSPHIAFRVLEAVVEATRKAWDLP